MEVRFVDANVFLRALTGSEPAQAAAARSLFLRVEAGTEKITTSPLVLFEVVFTLHSPRSYNHPKEQVVALLSPLLDLRGLKIANKSLWRQAFQTWLAYPIDFTDAYNVAVMRSQHIPEIYTWDAGFDRVPDIQRTEPVSDPAEGAQEAA